MQTAAPNTGRRVLVVIHLVGGNDALNTIVPYGDPLYFDARPSVRVHESEVLAIDQRVGFLPAAAPLKAMFDAGHVAVVLGVGYPNPNYSHFRSGDIWETAEPRFPVSNGWLGRVVCELDPRGTNPLTAINFGTGLPRSLAYPGATVASVADYDKYGLFVGGREAAARKVAAFSECFGVAWTGDRPRVADADPLIRMQDVLAHARSTASAALRGIELIHAGSRMGGRAADYPATPIGVKLNSVSKVIKSGLGTQLFCLDHGSFDLHALEMPAHYERWRELSEAIVAFYSDLRSRGIAEQVAVLMWSEFGRRVGDNGSGTDHGAGGVAFLIGDGVKGGLYGEYPSIRPASLVDGNLDYTVDFRQLYASVLDQWLEVDSQQILNNWFEQLRIC